MRSDGSMAKHLRPAGIATVALVLLVLLPSAASAQGGWEPRASMPVGQGGLAAVRVGGEVIALGGFSSGFADALATVQAYSPTADRWRALAPLPTPRGDLAAASLGG